MWSASRPTVHRHDHREGLPPTRGTSTTCPWVDGGSADLMPTIEQREYITIASARSAPSKAASRSLPWTSRRWRVRGRLQSLVVVRTVTINARGDVEPCVFIHYSNVNIRDMSWLRLPAPAHLPGIPLSLPLERQHAAALSHARNPYILPQIVKESGAKSSGLLRPRNG